MTKRHSLHLRLDDDGRAYLSALARSLGLDSIDAVRFAIKRAHDDLVRGRRS